MPSAAMGRLPPLLGRQFGRTRTRSSLGGKLVLIMTAVGLIATIAITLLLASVITPSFTKLEDKAIAGHVERARVALSDYAAKVENAVRDYGDWTDNYVDMADANEGFDRTSFLPVAMRDIGVDGMAYISPQGRTVIAGWHDVASEPRAKIQRQRLRVRSRAPILPKCWVRAVRRVSMHGLATRLPRWVSHVFVVRTAAGVRVAMC